MLSVKNEADAFKTSLSACTAAFGKCRKFEDDVGDTIHNCNQDTSKMKKKLKNLKENESALKQHQAKANSTANSRFAQSPPSARQITCAAFIRL